MDDVALTFDPTGFLKGIDAINKHLDTMNGKFDNSGKQSVKNNKTTKLAAGNLLAVVAKGAVVIGLIKSALRQIPEIGKAFQIAGGIAMKNFMWPLRRLLIPMLRKLLDWTRDNRAMFLRWGTTVANMFRGLFAIVKQTWEMMKRLWEHLSKTVERVFGNTFKSITELANIALFKVTAIIMFTQMMIEPFYHWLIDMFGKGLVIMQSFWDGMKDGIVDIMPALEDLSETWKRIWNDMTGVDDQTQSLANSFKILGVGIGATLGIALTSLTQALDSINYGIDMAILKFKMLKALGNKFEMKRLEKEELRLDREHEARADKRWAEQGGRLEEADVNLQKMQGVYEQPVKKVNTTNNKKIETTNNHNNRIVININGAKEPEQVGKSVKYEMSNVLRDLQLRAGIR